MLWTRLDHHGFCIEVCKDFYAQLLFTLDGGVDSGVDSKSTCLTYELALVVSSLNSSKPSVLSFEGDSVFIVTSVPVDIYRKKKQGIQLLEFNSKLYILEDRIKHNNLRESLS